MWEPKRIKYEAVLAEQRTNVLTSVQGKQQEVRNKLLKR